MKSKVRTGSGMGSAINWKEEIADAAGPFSSGDTRESWLSRAARRAGVNYRIAKGLWYGELKEPRFSVAVQILEAAHKQKTVAAKSTASQLASHYERLAESIQRTDEDFGSERAAPYIALVHALRNLDSA